jgi:hypothetical protein
MTLLDMVIQKREALKLNSALLVRKYFKFPYTYYRHTLDNNHNQAYHQ